MRKASMPKSTKLARNGMKYVSYKVVVVALSLKYRRLELLKAG